MESLTKNEGINKKCLKIPRINFDKILRIIGVVIMTTLMLINCYNGMLYARYDEVTCIEDRTHKATLNINDFFFNHTIINMIIKLIFSVLIDLSIIYTLVVWSLYSNNIRFLSSGISFILFNFLCRFLHIQIQPKRPAFYEKYIFSIFVNYKKTTYTFFPILLGILTICAFEWKRNKNNIWFWIIFSLLLGESFLFIIMEGNYFHEIFVSAISGHYFFMMNEIILSYLFGEDYLFNKHQIITVNRIKLDENETKFIEEENSQTNSDHENELKKMD